MGWRGMLRGAHEDFKITIANLMNRHLESIDPYAVRGAFVIAAVVAAHQEFAGGNSRAGGLVDFQVWRNGVGWKRQTNSRAVSRRKQIQSPRANQVTPTGRTRDTASFHRRSI